ncbi:MAG: hypothetical protein QOI41_5426, partial [Myxococcales bacterium]|nr:hypothetical protein [Myxococcales bacterium]
MSPFRAKLLSVLLVVAVAIPAAAHAANERSANLSAQREMDALSSAIGSIELAAGSERRVTLNGAPLFFEKTTLHGTLDEVMERVSKECASGNEASAFG